MGAISFIEEINSYSAKEGFNSLVFDAEHDYGNDPYNGTINTCSIGRCSLSFDKYLKSNINKALKFIKDKNNGTKYVANYIDLGVVEYEVLTVKAKQNKNFLKPNYKMKYVVKSFIGEKVLSYKDTLTEASNFAKKYTLDNNITCTISKEYIDINKSKNNVIMYIQTESKTYKTKPKLKDIPGRKIREIHKYLFYGWASC